MTRFAPYLTLGAVALLGAGLLVTNTVTTAAPPAPAALSAPVPSVTEPVAPPAVPDPAPADDGGGSGSGYGGAPAPAPAPAPGSAARDVEAVPEADGVRADAVYAGYTDGRGLTVAIAVTGDEAIAWVCGEGVEVWLRGPAGPGGELDLVSTSGRTTLTGSPEAGVVVSDGVRREFTAEEVDVAEAVAGGRPDVGEVAERAGLGG
jgi:hypothetical protein